VAFSLFLEVERFGRNPMLPLGVFASRQFSAANAVTFVVYGALGGTLFLLPVELQVVSHYSPLASGLALLPVTVIMLAFSSRSGRLASRVGPRLQMAGGPVVIGVGLVLLVRATHSGAYLTMVFPAVVVFGIGLAVTVAPLTATAMGAASPEHAGIASAVNNVVARAAALVAVAVLPLVAGIAGGAALQPAHFAAGFRAAVIIAGIICAVGGVLAAVTIRNPPSEQHLVTHHMRNWHCAIDGAPLQAAVSPAASDGGAQR
jgi:MFS family permease